MEKTGGKPINNDPSLINVKRFIKENPDDNYVRLFNAGIINYGYFIYNNIGVDYDGVSPNWR